MNFDNLYKITGNNILLFLFYFGEIKEAIIGLLFYFASLQIFFGEKGDSYFQQVLAKIQKKKKDLLFLTNKFIASSGGGFNIFENLKVKIFTFWR